MKTTVTPDAANRIELTKEIRSAAGIRAHEPLEITATPGMIVICSKSTAEGKIVKKGKVKMFDGDIPAVDIVTAIEIGRRRHT